MPTLSSKDQIKRNKQAYRAIRDYSASNWKLSLDIGVNQYYVSAVVNGRDCSPCLWNALIANKLVQPIPREQKSFMVPVDNFEVAVMKFQEWYPDAVIMKEWIAT